MTPEMIAMAKETANMFVFLAFELTLLFLAISYLVGILQAYIPPEKIQSILSSKNGKGYVIAALLGVITPFCSCSTIPFLKGLLRAKAGFGPMMVFLFASPLLNPIVIGLFVVTFSVEVAVFYFVIAMTVSVVAGVALEKLGFDRYIKQEALMDESPGCSGNTSVQNQTTSCCESNAEGSDELATTQVKVSACGEATIEMTEPSKWLKIWHSTWKDFKQALPYLLIGISIGSFIYGFMPTELITKYAGENVWYAIPLAAVIGIPLYIRASAVIPLSGALVQKGMALGSVMALIIGSAGASLTEVILLKSLFKNQMIIAFLVVVLGMAVSAGYLYGYLFG